MGTIAEGILIAALKAGAGTVNGCPKDYPGAVQIGSAALPGKERIRLGSIRMFRGIETFLKERKMSDEYGFMQYPHISTAGMKHEDWLETRKGSIGGSEAGAVMGMNNFASPLTVYLEKKGLVPASEMSRAAQRGKILEPVIRQRTIEAFPARQFAAFNKPVKMAL